MKQKAKGKAMYDKKKIRTGTGFSHDSLVRLFALYRVQVYERYYPINAVQKENIL